MYTGGRRASGTAMEPLVSTETLPAVFLHAGIPAGSSAQGEVGSKVQDALGSGLEGPGKSFN